MTAKSIRMDLKVLCEFGIGYRTPLSYAYKYYYVLQFKKKKLFPGTKVILAFNIVYSEPKNTSNTLEYYI